MEQVREVTPPPSTAAEPVVRPVRALPPLRRRPAFGPSWPQLAREWLERFAATWDGTRPIHWPIILPLLILLGITIVFRWTAFDVTIASLFYDAQQHAWPWFNSPVCTWFYRKGTYPACGVAIAAGMWLLSSLVIRRSWRGVQASVFLLAVFAVGPGLIINWGLKSSWGRPRPHQLQQFGGVYAFVPVGSPGRLRHNSSFPSGHAAVAFYLIAPAFLIDERRRRLAHAVMFAALAFGCGMGAVRVVQGGHFVSDVVWSAAIVYFTSALMARVVLRPDYS